MGAGFCSLYHEIHYIEVRYIKVWVYFFSIFGALSHDKMMMGLKNCENGYLILKVVWVSAMHQDRGLEKLGFFFLRRNVMPWHAIYLIQIRLLYLCTTPNEKKQDWRPYAHLPNPTNSFLIKLAGNGTYNKKSKWIRTEGRHRIT